MLAVVTSKRLTPEQVHAVGVAALENAVSIMADAGVLLLAERPRRAYALGVTAAEEFTKSRRCRDLLFDWTDGITVSELKATLRPGSGKAHLERYAEALDYLWGLSGWTVPIPAGFEDLTAVAKEDMKARNRVSYVEVAPNGLPMTPDGVDEDEARTWVSAMIRHFATLGQVWRTALDDAFAAARSESG